MQAMMATLTAMVLAAFAGYAGAWYAGLVEGNFALLLMLAVVVTGVYWIADKAVFLPQRRKAAQQLQLEHDKRIEALSKQGFQQIEGEVDVAKQRLLMQPWWLDWTAGLFPVIFAVFILRSFLFEPFKIPSGSMIPTLRIGDLILVNKFHYGVRLPVFNRKIFANHDPERGDVMVFRYPPQPSLDYIKRVIGVPGDEVAYINKQLTINGQPVPHVPQPNFFDSDSVRYAKQFRETIGEHSFNSLVNDDSPAFVAGASEFPYRDQCNYTVEGVVCKVPPGHYFMMGDNRDNSADSRYWGFVPEANIVGKAFFVWMNFGDLGRIGSFE
ncbi:signal peptidase I [Hydrogenophaga sp.]|uniref:signal peptidase I n=1 Tax=Hydrogenophaga sp. TaxID=1904254 RepID=UPI003569E6B7